MPVDIRFRISDVVSVIERFGGKQLYGNNPLVPLRELIDNAADAIRARVTLTENAFSHGQITVRTGMDKSDHWIEVEDNGIGMSEAVLKGPLLDFGTSYWRSHLSQREHPGLLSSEFEPTGRFGIGFFSVFMIGRRARVVTRPYLSGEQDTKVLEIAAESGVRPYIRHPTSKDKSERMIDGGTRVRIYLDNSRLIGDLFNNNHYDKRSPLERLSRLVGSIAPTLDIAVHCATAGDEYKKTTLVVGPNDWENMPFEKLAERVAGGKDINRRHIGSPLKLISNNQVVGRVLLAGASMGSGQGVLTVRGLSTFETNRTFDGVMCAEQPDLSRSHAHPIATADNLREAVTNALDGFRWREIPHWIINCGSLSFCLISNCFPMHSSPLF